MLVGVLQIHSCFASFQLILRGQMTHMCQQTIIGSIEGLAPVPNIAII